MLKCFGPKIVYLRLTLLLSTDLYSLYSARHQNVTFVFICLVFYEFGQLFITHDIELTNSGTVIQDMVNTGPHTASEIISWVNVWRKPFFL